MPIDALNPPGVPDPAQYTQVAVATGTRTVYVAGQVARDADGNPVGEGDLAAQTAQAMRNVATVLAGVGGTWEDVAALTVYVVGLDQQRLAEFGQGAERAAVELGNRARRPVTLVGVAALAEPHLLVEIQATAVLP